jgi:DNA-binding MarR family transcriptional regulator
VAGRAEAPISVRGSLEFLQVLWRTSHALERRSRRMEKAIGLTAPQRQVVRFLGRFPGVTAGQLARALHVDPGTLSTSVRRLEGRGLVERRRDPADTRRVTLGLTGPGRALDVPGPGTVEAAADALLADVSPRDLAATVRVLDRFAEILLADDGAGS